jgi:FMN reductase
MASPGRLGHDRPPVDLTVLVGNPKPASRTLEAAVSVANRLTGAPPRQVIDLAAYGSAVLGDTPAVAEAIGAVQGASGLVVASPTYKASYTGLLKVFLDHLPSQALTGVVAFPLMLGGAWQHALAPEVFLRPVLVELGATCPVPGLFLLDSDYLDPPGLAEWVDKARPFLSAP